MLYRYLKQMIVELSRESRTLIPALLEVLWELLKAILIAGAKTLAFLIRIIRKREWAYLELYAIQTAYLAAMIALYSCEFELLSYLGGILYLLGMIIFADLATYVGGEMREDSLMAPTFLSLSITGAVLGIWHMLK